MFSGSLQPILGKFIVPNLPTRISKTPHALYRAMFLYIVAEFCIGWLLPVNGQYGGCWYSLCCFICKSAPSHTVRKGCKAVENSQWSGFIVD